MSRSISITNTVTKEETHFTSINKCAAFLGIKHPGCLVNELNKNTPNVAFKGYFLKDTQHSVFKKRTFRNKKEKDTSVIPVRITHIETNTVEVFRSMGAASVRLGINVGLVSYYLKKKQPKPYIGYLIQYANTQDNVNLEQAA